MTAATHIYQTKNSCWFIDEQTRQFMRTPKHEGPRDAKCPSGYAHLDNQWLTYTSITVGEHRLTVSFFDPVDDHARVMHSGPFV